MRRLDPGLLGLLALLLGALMIGVVRFGFDQAAPAPEAQNLAEVMGPTADADAFARVTGPRPLEFPADHGAHPDHRTEWWYFTGNLTAGNGDAYGFQLTLFRSALAPGEREGWGSPQVWFAHAAVTTSDEHYSTERFARGGIGQAGVRADPFI